MRIGLVGGTFNPIHRGHVQIATAARRHFQLDRVVLVPAARPPHKADSDLAPAEDRLAMARLAVRGCEPPVEVSSIELERTGRSFTIDTVRAFQAASPGAEIYFIVGGDSVPELRAWKDARALLAMAHFAVAPREATRKLASDVEAAQRELGAPLEVLPIVPDPVSATDIRARIREGRPIDGLVPDAVRDYIAAHHLYQAKATEKT
jgi:nicotinate-nucleotide adenylyltransferase